MDPQLQEYLQAMEARMMQRLEGRMDAVEDRMKSHVSRSIENMETKIVGEFWKWGRTSDMRTRQALGEAAALNERMLNAEDRISALERKSAS